MDNARKLELLRDVLFDATHTESDREIARRTLERISLEGSDLERNQASRILFEHRIASASPITKALIEFAGPDPLVEGFWQRVFDFFAERQIVEDVRERVLREVSGNPDLAKLLAYE